MRQQAITQTDVNQNQDSIRSQWVKTLSLVSYMHHIYSFKKMHLKMSPGNWQPFSLCIIVLTHWGRVTHIYFSKLTIIGSDNGLALTRWQAIIRTNAGILLIWTVGTNFSEILSEIHTFSFKKMHLKMSSVKWWQFCLGLNVLTCFFLVSNALYEPNNHKSYYNLCQFYEAQFNDGTMPVDGMGMFL